MGEKIVNKYIVRNILLENLLEIVVNYNKFSFIMELVDFGFNIVIKLFCYCKLDNVWGLFRFGKCR